MKPRIDPPGLSVEIVPAEGEQFEWRADARDPEDRPHGIRCGSKLQEGFDQGGVTLKRPAGRTYLDLGRYDTIRFVDPDGRIVYEGRGTSYDVDTGEGGTRTVGAVGWMTHARDRPCLGYIYVDREPQQFLGDISATRREFLEGGVSTFSVNAGTTTVVQDSGGDTLMLQHLTRLPAAEIPWMEAWYDAGPGATIGKWYGALTLSTQAEAEPFAAYGLLSDDDEVTLGEFDATADLAPATAGAYYSATLPSTRRFLALQFQRFAIGPAADGRFKAQWRKLAVYGDHGLTLYGTDPKGVLASDVIIHSAGEWAPMFDTSGVQASAEVIDQLAVRDLTDPYDMWLAANDYERWGLHCWENRTLTYAELDYTAATWELDTTDRGVSARFPEPGTEADFNGMIVQFTDVATGRADMVMPDTHGTLADADPNIAANRHGLDVWAKLKLPDPVTPDGAAAIGAKVLADLNRARQPAQVTVHGWIRDAGGVWQPAHMARAGETVVLADIDDRPRLIHEGSWDEDSKTATLTLDAASEDIDAIADRLLTDGRRR